VVGGWPDMAVDKNKTHTGRYAGKIYNPNSYILYYHSPQWLQISLPAATKYKYSGWFFSDGPQVALYLFMKRAGETGYLTYVDAVTTTSTGKWVYLEKVFDVPADVTQLNVRVDNYGGGSVWFDDIRLHPAAAKMTSYTYDPLVGVTSQSDINSRPTLYEYDAFGRLAVIRDKDNNVIKKICYNYAGQSNTCAIFGNQIQSQTFTKYCTSGTGSQVQYTVPAGTYSAGTQADANTLALNDIAANGQNYANLNGTCSAPTNVTVNGNNYVSVAYYVQFYNVALNQSYTLYIPAYSNGSVVVPSGNYNVSFSAGGSPVNTTYRVNGYSTYGTSANFNNIAISNGSQVVIGN
jgi:YD repeat-containing protein